MTFQEELKEYLEGRMQQNLFSGVLIIQENGKTLFEGAYGFASRSWNIPNTLNIRFDTASITKLFTAIATLQLIEKEAFTLDTKVIPFLKLKNTTIQDEVTVYHLLTHSSGIGDDCEEEAGEKYEDLWKSKPNYAVTTTSDFLPQFITKPSNFKPGTSCRYCNCAFILLGLMLEKVTGTPYRDYVRRNIFEVAGMSQTDFFRMNIPAANVAEGCDPLRDDKNRILYWKKNIYSFPPVGSPDSGAYVTAADLLTFHRAVKEGMLLSPQITEEFLKPHVLYRQNTEGKIMCGYVWEFYYDTDETLLYYQKDGINAGVSAILRHYPDKNISIALLSNMEHGVWQPIGKIHDLLNK